MRERQGKYIYIYFLTELAPEQRLLEVKNIMCFVIACREKNNPYLKLGFSHQ